MQSHIKFIILFETTHNSPKTFFPIVSFFTEHLSFYPSSSRWSRYLEE